MALKVKGLASLNAKLKRLGKAAESGGDPGGGSKAMDRIAARATLLVIDRTRKGRDSTGVKGKAFAKYSKQYAEYRGSKGRKTRVDLTFTGNLLSSITHKAKKSQAAIFWRKPDENLKAHGLHNGNPKHNVPARPFFGLTRDEERKIMRMIAESVRGVIK